MIVYVIYDDAVSPDIILSLSPRIILPALIKREKKKGEKERDIFRTRRSIRLETNCSLFRAYSNDNLSLYRGDTRSVRGEITSNRYPDSDNLGGFILIPR